MPADYCLVLCTCPDLLTAHNLAESLLSDRRAACVNILPGVSSMYLWQGKIESASEVLLLIKTRTDMYSELEAFIAKVHPYDVPEIVALPFVAGSPPYLSWISSSLEPTPNHET